MLRKSYQWQLYGDTDKSIERYCNHCGRKAIFRDTKKRRCNANGKDLYEYAIYKCEKDHTWNLLLRKYKAEASVRIASTHDDNTGICIFEKINLLEHANSGIEEIEITLTEVTRRWRLDKLLGERIIDISRNKVNELILKGKIHVDGETIKPGTLLKKQQKITIILKDLFPDNTIIQR